MNIRPKTIRRLLILFCVLVMIAGGFFWAYRVTLRRNAANLAELRSQAMAVYAAGDYAQAVDLLGGYIAKSRSQNSDPDVLFAYGKSRISVEMAGGRQVQEGIQIFQSYLKLRPNDSVARHELLRLYTQAGYNSEAIALADTLLAANPQDIDALKDKSQALINQHKPADALAASRRLNEVAPLDLRGQLLTLSLMRASGVADAQMLAYAAKQRQRHPGDPRFEVAQAYACEQVNNDEEARQWLRAAAARTPPDAGFLLEIVRQLDAVGLYSDAEACLRRGVNSLDDLLVNRLFAQRLWQDRKYQELADRLKALDPANPLADGVLLGYRGLALHALRTDGQLAAFDAALGRRADAASIAWSKAFGAVYAPAPLAPAELAARTAAAAARLPANPVLHVFNAQALLRTGEVDLALEQLGLASRLAPSWSMPFVLRSQALDQTGRFAEAVAAANEAVRRAPKGYDAQTSLAKAAFDWISQTGSGADYGRLLPLLDGIQSGIPNEPQTLPAYVTVLARLGRRDDALKVLGGALDAAPPLPTETLLRLSEVCDAEKLEKAEEFRRRAQAAHGLSPEVALADARALLAGGKSAQGLRLLLDARKGHESEVNWRLAVAEYRELSHDPQALADWIALGDEFPGDLRVQENVLSAPSRTMDRAFWARTIDRLKAAGGEQGLSWRIARAQWLLSGEPSEKDNAEAVNLLTQVTKAAPALPEPHQLLASAMLRVKNSAGAIAELTAAADARPGDPSITGQLVEQLIANNRSADALAYLDKLARNTRLPIEARHWLANMYAEMGHNDRALALLKTEVATGEGAAHRDWMMARLYRRMAKPDDAAPLYLALLTGPVADPAFWAEGADFFASRLDMKTATQFLDRLNTLPLRPGTAELARARFAEQWQGISEALAQYNAATKKAADSPQAWVALAGFHLRHRQFADAAATATAGLVALPDNALLRAMQADAGALAALGAPTDYQPLINALSGNPLDPGAAEMLGAVAQAQSQKLAPLETARKIASVADKHPSDLSLQAQAVQAFAGAGDFNAAGEVALRAAGAAPDSAEPHRLLAGIFAATGDWSKAREQALLWRQRSPDDPYAADLAIAETYLQQPAADSAGAIQALSPYVRQRDSATRRRRAVELYAKALLIAGRGGEAADLLKPLTATAPAWRIIWLDLASSLRSAHAASDWINRISTQIPADSPKEQLALAKAWYELGLRFDSSKALDSARGIEDTIGNGPDVSSQVSLLRALTAQAQGDYAVAEAAYRRVAKDNPAEPNTLNDLAYLLWLKGRPEDLPEARRLSSQAVAARPNVASFYDTLARIEARSGNRQGAESAFRSALKLDPNSIEAMVGLADLLSRQPTRRNEAHKLLSDVQLRLIADPPLSSTLRKQIRDVGEALARAS